MKALYDLQTVARMLVFFIIAAAAGYMLYVMVAVGNVNKESQTEKIKEVIDKALVQCYALEGSYPLDIDYLEKYGVILDKTKYFYYYDMLAINMKPSVKVFDKQ